MDSTVAAALLGAGVAGPGGLLVPRLIALVPAWEPTPPAEGDATVDAVEAPADAPNEPALATETATGTRSGSAAQEEPPEPYADIAALPGLAWKSALAGAVAGAVVGAGAGWEWAWLLWVPFVPVYLALAVIDWRTRLLPTYLIAPTLVALVALVLLGWAVTGDAHAVVRAGLGLVTCGGFYFLLWLVHPRGLGFGDVRLSGPLGVALGWIGWGQVFVGVYAGFLLGGVIGGLLAVVRIVERKGVPFGPFMLLGAVAGLLWGGSLWSGLVGG
jgi:leader peptidase (prepilin peptidase)/N-methyltransferase